MASGTSEEMEKQGRFGWLRRLDDLVYSVEQAIVVSFLSAMTIMVFLDVVDRRLSSPDSKIGDLLGRLFGVTNPDTKAWLDGSVSPVVAAILGFGILWFAVSSVVADAKPAAKTTVGEGPFRESEQQTPEQARHWNPKALGYTVVTAAALTGLGALMMARTDIVDEYGTPQIARLFPSKYVYLLLFVVVAGPLTVRLLKTKPDGWERRVAGIAVGGGLLAWFALRYFPDEFSWSLEVSGIMLLWVGALGASICAYAGKHIRLDALQKTVPARAKKYVAAAGFFISALFAAILSVLGYGNLDNSIMTGMAFEQTQIPDWVATGAIPLAFALTALRFGSAGVSVLMGGNYGAFQSELASLVKGSDDGNEGDGEDAPTTEEVAGDLRKRLAESDARSEEE